RLTAALPPLTYILSPCFLALLFSPLFLFPSSSSPSFPSLSPFSSSFSSPLFPSFFFPFFPLFSPFSSSLPSFSSFPFLFFSPPLFSSFS
ncbi:hypothetical protein ACXWRS_10325, partial [Streptococcus pyogenes]